MEDAGGHAVNVATDPVDTMVCSHCGVDIDVSEVDSFSHIECPSCGAEQSVPARLGQFLLLHLISTGGMGGVFRARDESLGRMVAIKVMLESLGEDKEFVENFKREAQSAAQLNHPNVVQIYSFGQAKGQPYIVMELVSGRRFDKMVEGDRQMDPALVLEIGIGAAEGLKAASDHGLVHGDVKPENILLDEKGTPKIVDFGLASYAHQVVAGGIWGTPYYIAPEKVRRQRVDERADIYSLGATLFHALTGRPPFEGDTPVDVVRARLDEPAPPLQELIPDINESLATVIARMLDDEPGRRYPTYASLLGDMRRALKEIAPKGRTGRGKRVVIKKRGAGQSSAILDTGETPGAARPTGKHKLVIRKSTSSRIMAPVHVGRHEPAVEAVQPEPPDRTGLKVFLIVLAVLVFIGGATGLGIFLKLRIDKQRAARTELLALRKSKGDAEQTFKGISLAVTNIVNTAAATESIVDRTTEAVMAALGESMELPPLPPEPEPAEDEGTEEAPADEGEEAGAAAGEGPAAAGEDAMAEDMQPDDAAAGEPVAVDEEPMDAFADVPPADEPEVKILAREIFADVIAVKVGARRALRIEADARMFVQAVNASADSTEAGEKAERLAELLDEAETIEKTSRDALDRASQTTDKLTRLAADAIAQRKAEEAARAAEAARLAAEEARRQAEAEARAKIDAEIQMAEAARQGVAPRIAQHDFEKAVRDLGLTRSNYKTDEGKQALAIVMERCERMQKMKELFIAQLSTTAIPWGWGQGPSATDVLGADKRYVRLRDRRVTWAEVPPSQMLRFADHYIDTREVGLRGQADLALAAAIYCAEIGGERGSEMSQAYASQAVNLLSSMQRHVDRLMQPAKEEPPSE